MNPSDVIDGRYRVERLLGTGGVAEVWLAEDQRLERWVAVKVLREGFGTEHDSDLVQSFEREARVIARLQHPNIVGVYDAGRFGTRHYLVMEYVHGHTLRQILDAQGRLAERDAIRYGAHIAGALQYAHERGVIHCDVKPENIIVTEQGVPKVTDFGVAETISRTLSPDQARDIVGTIAYLAPEVLQGSPATPRSDVYSLSMTVYEAIAGRLPFSGGNPAAVAGQRLAAPAPSLRTFARDASPEVEAVLARGLSVSPLDRQASAAEFASALQRAGAGVRAGAQPVGATVAAAGPVVQAGPAVARHSTARIGRRPPPRSRAGGGALVAVIVVVLVALALGGAGAWLLSRSDDSNGATPPTPGPTTGVTQTAAPTAARTPSATQRPETPTSTATAMPTPTSAPTNTATPPPTATKPPSPTKAPATPSPTQNH